MRPSNFFRVFGGKPRSGRWGTVRRAFLAEHPFCAACGNAQPDQLEVHHIHPYHLPGGEGLELEWSNLITLCCGSGKCHFVLGHLLSWKSWNADVVMDAGRYFAKVVKRPQ